MPIDRSTEEGKERHRLSVKKYRESEAGRRHIKEYRESEAGKEKRRLAGKKYKALERVKEKSKLSSKKYRESEAGKEKIRERRKKYFKLERVKEKRKMLRKIYSESEEGRSHLKKRWEFIRENIEDVYIRRLLSARGIEINEDTLELEKMAIIGHRTLMELRKSRTGRG